MVNLICIKIYFHYILIMSSYCVPLINHNQHQQQLHPISSLAINSNQLDDYNQSNLTSDLATSTPFSSPLRYSTSSTSTMATMHETSSSFTNLTKFPSKFNSKCSKSPSISKLFKIDSNQSFVPEEVLITLSQIKSGKQLIDYLTDDDYNNRNSSSNLLRLSNTSKRKPRNIPAKSKPSWLDHFPGTCSPENQTQVIKSSQGKSEIYFPGCIKIPRCSGCCPSDRLICQPTQVSNITVEVMVLRYIPHSRRFKYAGRQRFTFSSHIQCSCTCIQKEADCNRSVQLYKSEECRCVCRDLSTVANCTADPAKYWDSVNCSCKCLRPHNCSSGLQFNEKTCSCEASLNGSLSHQQHGFNQANNNNNNDLIMNVNHFNSNGKLIVAPSTSLWDYSSGFNLLSRNVQDGELNEMDKLHKSFGFQGINPSSSVPLALPPS